MAFRTSANSVDPNATSQTFCNWRDVSWIYLIPSGLLGLLVFFVPESPRWLAEHKGLEAAKKVLLRLHGHGNDGHSLFVADPSGLEDGGLIENNGINTRQLLTDLQYNTDDNLNPVLA
mmetsp:Transcript_10447/g.8703  ORF Transcript_10447/g.8703 Transcript_10447/m.8703 type:complete len:118 (+) Transcript_10447:74-427(+)